MTPVTGQMSDVVRTTGAWRELSTVLTRHRELLWAMTRRELTDRYAGQWLGALWIVVHPLLVMAVYLVAFAVIFTSRLQDTPHLPPAYAVFLLAGLIPWMMFQEAMSRGCTALTAQAELVKQVVFPVEVLPVSKVLAACVPHLIALAALITYVGARGRLWLVALALLPWLLVVQGLAMLGAGFLLSSVSVYVRDLRELVQVAGFIGIYLIPVFYPIEWVPPALRLAWYLNPFVHMIWCYQDVLYAGRFEHPSAWVLFPLLAVAAFWAGFAVFRRLKPHVSDAL